MLKRFEEARHLLGTAKFRLRDDLPYRSAMAKANAIRALNREAILGLPQIPASGPDVVEVHMLCGKAHYDMGVAASWSLMRYLPGSALYVHSDGTLEEGDLEPWRRVIGNLHFVPKAFGDERVREVLSRDYPLLHEWRTRNWAAYQVLDYSLFGRTGPVISCDSDVLCLSDPVYLRAHLDTDAMMWNEDLRTCYSLSVDELSRVTGLHVLPRLNCGFLLMPRLTLEDYANCEAALERLTGHSHFDINHVWSSQTYLALIAAAQPGARPLPPEYSVRRGPSRADTVVRHYVGVPSIRSRYYLEGCPTLLAQAETGRSGDGRVTG